MITLAHLLIGLVISFGTGYAIAYVSSVMPAIERVREITERMGEIEDPLASAQQSAGAAHTVDKVINDLKDDARDSRRTANRRQEELEAAEQKIEKLDKSITQYAERTALQEEQIRDMRRFMRSVGVEDEFVAHTTGFDLYPDARPKVRRLPKKADD